MRRVVVTFGLIAGLLMSLMMATSMAFFDRIGFDRGMIVGYASMVLSFLLIYFGVRSYRDGVAGGAIGFGRALAVGLLIMLVASACYVATWLVIYYGGFVPDHMQQYADHVLAQARAGGASEAELAAQAAEMARFRELYANPFVNAAFTFLEPLPVGVLMSLVSAAVLRRRPNAGRTDVPLGSRSIA